jgi:hypothetical protein
MLVNLPTPPNSAAEQHQAEQVTESEENILSKIPIVKLFLFKKQAH